MALSDRRYFPREEVTLLALPETNVAPRTERMTMPDHVYRIIQVAGSSEKSIEDAIQNAVGRASRTLRQVGWFEVLETRGHVEDGKVAHYQVTLKIGFTLDDDD
jgi:dodecin